MATKKFNLEECSIVNDLIADLKEKYAMIVPRPIVIGLFRAFKRSYALMCKSAANKTTKKISFQFKDTNGEFIVATILTFVPPVDEDSDDAGNWNLSMSYDIKDTEGSDVILDTFTDIFMSVATTEIFSSMNAYCGNRSDIITICAEFERKVLQFLDANSNESPDEVELIMEGVFTASVGIENGEKKYAIVPGYAVKQIIKNDDEAEKVASSAIDAKAAFINTIPLYLCTTQESFQEAVARSNDQPISVNGTEYYNGNPMYRDF